MLKLTEQVRADKTHGAQADCSGTRLRRVRWPVNARAHKRMEDLAWQINFAKIQMQRRRSIGEVRYAKVNQLCKTAEAELDALKTSLIFG